jgi:hypothetical protein
MPSKGQVLTNPENGNSFEYIATAKDTNGACVVVKATIKGERQKCSQSYSHYPGRNIRNNIW